MTTKFKPGDFVYYYSKDGLISARVMKRTSKTVRISGDFPEPPMIRSVKPDNCQLQDEWKEENQ